MAAAVFVTILLSVLIGQLLPSEAKAESSTSKASISHTEAIERGYRYEVTQAASNQQLPHTFIAATFSGGGMRAAALSYGTLKALHDTFVKVPTTDLRGPKDKTVRLVSEVDYVTSVSGGSVTAAHWALLGPSAVVTNYEKEFIARKVRTELIRALTGDHPSKPRDQTAKGVFLSWWKRITQSNTSAEQDESEFSVVNSLPPIVRLIADGYSRINFLSEYYQGIGLKQATYEDLLTEAVEHGDRPFLVINATDIVTRSLFPFVQIQYDLMCSRLNSLKLADAVAASTAYPAVFNSLAIENLRVRGDTTQSEGHSCPGVFTLQQLTPHAPSLTLGEDLTNNVEILAENLSSARGDFRTAEEDLSNVRRELAEVTDLVQEKHIEYKEATLSTHSKRKRLHQLNTELVEAHKYENTARDVLRFFSASERAREKTYSKSRKALEDFESASDGIQNSSKDELSHIQAALRIAEQAVRENVTELWDSLFRFAGPWLEGLVRMVSAKQSATTSLAETGVEAPSEGESPDEFSTTMGVLQGEDEMGECDAVFSASPSQEMQPLLYTLRHFAGWVATESAKQRTSVPGQLTMGALPGKRLPLDGEALGPGLYRKYGAISHRAMHARLAGLSRRIAEDERWMAAFEGNQWMEESDRVRARVVLRLLDSLEASIAEEHGSIDLSERSLTRSAAGEMGVSLSTQPHATTPVPAEVWTRGVATALVRASDLSSLVNGIAAHVEVLKLAQVHGAKQMEIRELQQRLSSSQCKMEKLQEQAGSERSQLQEKADGAMREWILAKDKTGTVAVEYASANRKLSELRNAHEAVQRQLEEEKARLEVAEAQYRRALEMKKALGNRLSSLTSHLEDTRKIVESLEGQYGRADALRNDYQFMARRVRDQVPYYFDGNLEYVHVLDGGVADNLGITPLLELLASFREDFRVDHKYSQDFDKGLNHMAIFSVDARRAAGSDFGKELTSPGILQTIDATVSTAIEGKSSLLTEELEQATEALVRDGIVGESHLVRINFDTIRNFHIHDWDEGGGHIHGPDAHHPERGRKDETVKYPKDTLDECVHAFKKIPTDWDLEDVEKQALIRIGYALVRDTVAYRDFVGKFDGDMAKEDDTVEDVCLTVTEDLKTVAEKRKEKKRDEDATIWDFGHQR